VTPPTWSDVARDLDLAGLQAGQAVAKHATLAAVPADLLPDRQVAIGKHVHDAYSAAEQALERLIAAVDGDLPSGRRFHQDLIDRASRPLDGVRPAIIAPETARDLRALLRFRHAFRHVYDVFDYELAAPNVALAATAIPRLRTEVTAFAAGLGLAPRA
jgi:hypothetical protein